VLALLVTAPGLAAGERPLPALATEDPPLLLGGLLPLDDGITAGWPWAGAWTWPLGSACDFTRPSPAGEPEWRLLRGFTISGDVHFGADLANGRGGDVVHAAANGVVVVVRDRPDDSGYGSHVVLAHRLLDGEIAYSVYSHLRSGSTRVREGHGVWAGDPLGEVGRSGHATTEHLHFEVRQTRDPAARWENEATVDPLPFVEPRLPAHRADTSWAGPYLEWAERAGLIEPAWQGDEPLARATWQRILARAARLPLMDLPPDAGSLRETLVDAGLLPMREHAALRQATAWRDLRRDLATLVEYGANLPPAPLEATRRRATCRERFRIESPAGNPGSLYRNTPPTLADACLLLADLAAGAPPPSPAPEDRPR
jgi:hypothetical protein